MSAYRHYALFAVVWAGITTVNLAFYALGSVLNLFEAGVTSAVTGWFILKAWGSQKMPESSI